MTTWTTRPTDEAGMDQLVYGLIGLGVTLFLVVGLCVWVWTMLLGCA